MKLNIQERFQMQNFLPPTGSLVDLSATYSILKKVDFSKEEIEKYEMKVDGKEVTWNIEKDEEVDMSLCLSEKNLLIRTLEQKDREGTLNINSMTLYNKIKELEKE